MPHPCPQHESSEALREAPLPMAFGPTTHNAADLAAQQDTAFWRGEVASRVQQHREKRHRSTGTSNTTMELDFLSGPPLSLSGQMPSVGVPFGPSHGSPAPTTRIREPIAKAEPPKIIRFPMPAAPFAPPEERVVHEELAGPAPAVPRILEAIEVEQMDLLPSYADIHLGPERPRYEELEKYPRPAPMRQRCISGLMDAGTLLFAFGLFALIFTQLAEAFPQTRAAAVAALGVLTFFGMIYQYLFLVHGSGTIGMRLTQLEVFTFKGERPRARVRKVRVLASMLSGLSLGFGFAWAFIDEDMLGWHDRISGTYLKLGPQHAADKWDETDLLEQKLTG